MCVCVCVCERVSVCVCVCESHSVLLLYWLYVTRPVESLSSALISVVRAVFSVSAACLCSLSCALRGSPSCRRCCLCCCLCSRSRPHTGAWAGRRCPSAVLRGAPAQVHSGERRLDGSFSWETGDDRFISSPPSTPASGPPARRTSSPTPG